MRVVGLFSFPQGLGSFDERDFAGFAKCKTMDDYIGRDLREKLNNPLVFQRKGAAAENPVVGDYFQGCNEDDIFCC